MLFSTPSQFVVLGLVFLIGLIFAFVIHPGGAKWKREYQEEVEANASFRDEADTNMRTAKRRIADLEREKAALEQRIAATSVPVTPVPASEVSIEAAPPPAAALAAESESSATPIFQAIRAVDATPAPPVIAPAPEAVAAPEPVVEATPAVEPAVEEAAPTEAPVVAAQAIEAISAPAAEATPITAPMTDEAKRAWLGAAGYNDLTQIRSIDTALNNKLFGLGVTRFADIEKLSAEDEMALEERLPVPAGFIAREQWREQAALLRAGNFAEHNQRFSTENVLA